MSKGTRKTCSLMNTGPLATAQEAAMVVIIRQEGSGGGGGEMRETEASCLHTMMTARSARAYLIFLW